MSVQNQQFLNLDLLYEQCSRLAEQIDRRRTQIHNLLADYETHEVIEHEIKSSIEALQNVADEYKDFEQPEDKVTVSCFLPVNMPLYSLVLYAVLPSFYYETVYVRPGMALSKYIPAIAELLNLSNLGFERIKIKDLPAKLFVDLYAKDSEVILFTGKYENARMLERECPESLLIFEGTGPCPFFVFEDADVELAAEKAVAMRCFNSGQDCVAPDVIFVHQSILDNFTNSLIKRLRDIPVGDSRDKSVRIAPMIKEKYLLAIEKWLEKNRKKIIFGGEVDNKQLIIYPTVILQDATTHKGPFMELFSPIFNLVSFADNQSVIEIISSTAFKERSMYACTFGANTAITSALSLSTILENMTVNDQENGNQAYGGYGALANFVSYKGVRKAHPLLISRDIRNWMLPNKVGNLADHALQIA